MRIVGLLTLTSVALLGSVAGSAERDSKALVKQVVTAAGGEDKLLKLFRIRERLNVSPDPGKKGAERVSVLEPPKYWWLGKRERVNEAGKGVEPEKGSGVFHLASVLVLG